MARRFVEETTYDGFGKPMNRTLEVTELTDDKHGKIVTLPLVCTQCQRVCRPFEMPYCLNCQQPFCHDCRPGMSASLVCGCPVENSPMYKAGQRWALEREERLLEAMLTPDDAADVKAIMQATDGDTDQ